MKVAHHWRINAQRYRMDAQVDENGIVSFPPRPVVKQRTETYYVLAGSVVDQQEAEADLQRQAELA